MNGVELAQRMRVMRRTARSGSRSVALSVVCAGVFLLSVSEEFGRFKQTKERRFSHLRNAFLCVLYFRCLLTRCVFSVFFECLYLSLFNSITSSFSFIICLDIHSLSEKILIMIFCGILVSIFFMFVSSFCHSLSLFTVLLFSIKCSRFKHLPAIVSVSSRPSSPHFH